MANTVEVDVGWLKMLHDTIRSADDDMRRVMKQSGYPHGIEWRLPLDCTQNVMTFIEDKLAEVRETPPRPTPEMLVKVGDQPPVPVSQLSNAVHLGTRHQNILADLAETLKWFVCHTVDDNPVNGADLVDDLSDWLHRHGVTPQDLDTIYDKTNRTEANP